MTIVINTWSVAYWSVSGTNPSLSTVLNISETPYYKGNKDRTIFIMSLINLAQFSLHNTWIHRHNLDCYTISKELLKDYSIIVADVLEKLTKTNLHICHI